MVALLAEGNSLFIMFWISFCVTTSAQYENYSLRDFPKEELMPLTAAYGLALDCYAAGNWTGSIRYLELSLRLRRLLRDSVRRCALLCGGSQQKEPFSPAAAPDLRVSWHIMRTASCQKTCRARFPALQLPPPSRVLLEAFSRRDPYRYLYFAHSKLNDLQSAIPCAYTFLQRNPEDQEMQQLMEEYRTEYDLNGFLIDHEEQPYESPFVRGVKLVSSGDYSSSVEHLEEALRLYLQEFDWCQADCEGISHVPSEKNFYTLIAEAYTDSLKCKLKCEEHLKPNVGGYFVENFVPTIYHHLQYGYYKLNDGRRAVPCANSYSLFEPEDQVMRQNLLYYRAYSQQWGLEPDHFRPRTEAFKHYNQTVAQKQMLTFAEMYLEVDDEDVFGPEESPDAEFEGLGDYEESIYTDWRQMKGKGDVGESDI